MSILLDALKKSEAQRRLGETPTLQTSVSTDEGRNADRPQWIPLALILFSAGIMTWTGIGQFRPDDSLPATAGLDGNSAGVVVTQSPTEADSPPRGADEPKARPTTIRSQAQTQTRAGNAATTPVRDYVVDDPLPVSGARLPANRDGEAVETKSTQPAVALDGSGRGAETGGSRRVAHVEIEANTTAPASIDPAEAGQSTGQSSSQGAGQSAAQNDYALQTISYWQVPQSLREEMGEFRISVLVYAENPADRFLLVNGSRLREQEETNAGVRLEAIERDRAVFTYRDYRFHLKN